MKEARVMVATRLKYKNWQKLKKYCTERDISVSSLIKEMIKKLLKELEEKND